MIVAAHNEADRIGDDGQGAARGASRRRRSGSPTTPPSDGTAEVAMAAGARVVSRGRPHGKGANVSAAAEAALSDGAPPRDGPALRRRSRRLGGAAGAAGRGGRGGRVRPRGGGLRDAGSAAASAWPWASPAGRSVAAAASRPRRRSPASGRCGVEVLRAALPFARGYGMEIGMTVDAVRAGYRVGEYELDLAHRATGRSFARLHPPRPPATRLRPRLPRPRLRACALTDGARRTS